MMLHPMWPVVVVAVLAMAVCGYLAVRRQVPRTAAWRRVGIALLLVGVGLRPTIGTTGQDVAGASLDVVLVIDRTTSMAAEDYDGKKPRLDGVRADVNALLEQLAGARWSVVTFDNVGRVAVPWTQDATAISTFVETMGYVDPYYASGSSIDKGIEPTQQVLDSSQEREPHRGRVVIYLGDGEQNTKEGPASFAPLRDKLGDALVLGYGTTQGGKMKSQPGDSSYEYDKNTRGDAISKIDEQNLRTIADQLGGTYLHRTAPGKIDFHPDAPSTAGPDGARTVAGRDVYWALGLGISGLLLWELWDALGAYRVARRELS